MRAFTSRVKRSVALLLAVLLLVPTMAVHIHAEEPSSVDLMLSDLIVSNYDDLSAAEKAILSSGVLANDLEVGSVPTLDGHVEIELNAEKKSISAEAYSEGAYTWTPVSATLYVDGVEKEKITLTNGKGNYTYDGNAFYVDVTYSLTKEVADDDQAGHLALLNVAYNLYQDVTYLQQVTSKKDSLTMNGVKYSAVQLLNVLTDANIGSAMGLTGTIIDQLNELAEGVFEEFELPDGTPGEIYIELDAEAVEAAAALKQQQDENGGLALAKFFAKYGSLSMLEIVAEHEEELVAALLDSYTNVSAIANALPDLVEQVDDTVTSFEKKRGYLEKIYSYVYDVLSDVKDSYPEAGLDTYLADGEITSDEIKSLTATLDAEYKAVIIEINNALEGTGYSVTCAADISVVIADMEAKLDNIVDEINTALEGTGYSISDVEDLADLIVELDGKLTSALAEINAELAKLKDIDPELDFEVSSAAELAQVISILEAYLAEKEGELASAIAELNKELEGTGLGAVETFADIDGIIAKVEELRTETKEELEKAYADAVSAALTEINSALAEVNELTGKDYSVAYPEDIAGLISQIEADYATFLSELATVVNGMMATEFTFEKSSDIQVAIDYINANLSGYPFAVPAVQKLTEAMETAEGFEAAVSALTEVQTALADGAAELENAMAEVDAECDDLVAQLTEGKADLATAEAALADAKAALPELKTAQEELAEAEAALTELKEAETLLAKAEDGVAAMEAAQDALVELETVKSNLNAVVELENKVAELKTMGEALSTLSTAFGMLVADGVLDEAVATRNWVAGDHIADTAESADYQALTLNATTAAKTEAYTEADVLAEVYITSGTQRAAMSMHNVTVNVVLTVVNANNEMVNYTITDMVTLPDLTSGSTVENEVEKIEKAALAQWSGVYVAGKYTAGAPAIPDELKSDLEITITYNPVGVTVNYCGTEKNVPYGTTLALEPYTENAAYVYDYYVDGVKYLQGAKIVVKDDLTVTRELGKAYKTASLYNVFTAQFGETQVLVNLLNTNGVDIANQFYSVRYPENSDNLISTEVEGTDTVVTAENFASGYGDLVWVPTVAKVFGGSVEEVAFNGNEAVVEGAYEHLEIEYKLVLGLDADEILANLNSFVTIHDEAVDQLADMDTMVRQMSQLGLVTAAMGLFKDKAATQAAKDAIDYVNGPNCYNSNTGNLYLVDHVNNYADTTNRTDFGLYYYYLHSEDIIFRLNDLIPQIETVIDDPNFPEFLESYRDIIGDMSIEEIVDGIKELAASLESHPANELIVAGQEEAVAKALGNGSVPSESAHLSEKLGEYVTLPEGDPALVTTLVQAPAGQVALNITITVNDATGVGEPQKITKFYMVNSTLDDGEIAAIVAEALALSPEEWEWGWHTVVSDTGSEEFDLEGRLNTYKTQAMTSDVNISYVWSFACDHSDCTTATCVEGSYCRTCGTEVSGPDLENGHSLSTSVTTAPSCEKDGVETTKCSLCGMTTTTVVAKLGHKWGEFEYNDDATCTEDGTETRTCSRSGCNAHETQTAEDTATGHKYADSWITNGAEEHIHYCEYCQLPETHEHEWDDGEVTLAATCTKDGEMTYECTANGCTETYTEAIPATGHDFRGDWFYTEDGHGHLCLNCGEQGGPITAHTYATNDCTVRSACEDGCGYIKAAGEHVWAWTTAGEKYGIGSHTRTCENCSKTETADHVWDDGVVTVEPGCGTTGVLTHTCTLCAEDWLETIPAGAHDWGKWYADGSEVHSHTCANCGEVESEAHDTSKRVVTVEPTCDVHGEATYYCSVCDHAMYTTTEEADLAPLGHDLGEYVYNDDATCTEDGTKTAECQRKGCDYTHTVTAEGTAGHVFSTTDWVNLGDTHARPCENCDAVDASTAVAHDYGIESCDESGTCVCGAEYIGSADSHAWGTPVSTDDETHTSTCQFCDETKVEAHEHIGSVKVAPGCETEGEMLYTCACGHTYTEAIDPAGHTWGEYVLDADATCTEGGTETRTCSKCGETESREVPAKGHTWDAYENMGETGHIPVCSVCGEKGELTEHVWTVDEEKSNGGLQVSTCPCGAEKSELVGDSDISGKNGVVGVTLAGNGDNAQYAIEYTVNLGVFNGEELILTYTLNSAAAYSISNLAEEAANKYGYTTNELRGFIWTQYQAGAISVEWKLIDKYAATLVTFVQALNAEGVKGVIDFSLVETADGYAIYANVTDAAGAAGAIQNLVMALAAGGYNYIGFHNYEGVDQMFYDVTGPNVSLQGLIDGILAQDGFGTDRILSVVNANGTLNPASVPSYEPEQILVGGKIGGVLQTATMTLGTSSGNIQQTLPFYLTISDTAMIGQLIPALQAASAVVSIYTKDGALLADLTLPEKVYEAYMAAALVTGDVNKNDIEAVKSEAAFNYLYSYIKSVTAPGVTHETIENTAAKVGVNVDLSAYAGIIDLLIRELNSVNEVTADNRELKSVDISVAGKSVIDGALSATGMDLGPMASMLEMIVEYKAGGTIDLSLTANLVAGEEDFEVAVIDIKNGSTLDKVDLAENGAARINSLAGTAAVMLLGDVEGNLVFKHTTILDLNGHTVNGTIQSNGNLIIIDSSMANVGEVGGVTGAISGSVTILGGNYYGNNIADFLPEGYIVDNGSVRNELFQIVAEGEDLNVYIDPTAIPTSTDGLVELAADIAADLLLNYYTTAAFALDGNTVFEVNLPEILGMVTDSDKTELVNTLIGLIHFDGGLDYFINAITADLLNFGALAEGKIFSHGVTTKAWNLELVHVADEDYLDVTITSVNTVNNFNLNIVVDYEQKWIENFFTLLGDILDAGFEVDFEQPVYAPGSFSVGGSANAHANLVLADNPDYVMAFALLLTYHDAKIADALTGNVDLAYVQDVFNKMTLGQFCDALQALDEDVNFTKLAANVGWTYADTTVGLNELHLVLTAAGELIDSLRNAAEARDISLDRLMNAKFASLLNKETGIYEYGITKFSTTGTVSSIEYTLGESGVYVSADIFPAAHTVTYVSFGETVATEYAYTGFGYTLMGALTKEGYTFNGWNVNGTTYAASSEIEVTGNVTATADWTKNVTPVTGYTVTYVDGYSDGTHTVNNVSGEYTLLGNMFGSRSGYTFNGWDLGQPGDTITVTADVTVTAKWKVNYVPTPDPEEPDPPYVETGCCHPYHCPSSWYADLDVDAWYHTATDYAICRELMIGIYKGEDQWLWGPDMATSRAMIVTTLYRLEGSPEVEYTEHYTDVADGLWYSDAIVWATNNGIVEGYGNNVFGPEDYVTREQICTIFFRYANFKGLDTSDRADISDYVDADQVSDWALEAVQWDVAVGMIKGTSTTSKVLDPKIDTSRAMMAMLLLRWCEKVN